MAYTTEELGRLIARAHYQAWRLDAPPFDLRPEELAAILPNLIKSGSAGIVWHRVKPFREKYGAMAYALEAATNAQIAYNRRVEEAVVECVTRLRAHGIEPVLVKGLALAKLYPEGIVRPAGDIDLVVRKEEFAAAHAILHDSSRDPISVSVDLHSDPIWKDRPSADFRDRLIRTPIAATNVYTPCIRDHYDLLHRHYIRHGGQRILRLSDICCLSDVLKVITSDPTTHHSDPILDSWKSAIQHLSVEMLGANEENGSPRSDKAPIWFVEDVLKQWQINEPLGTSALRELADDPKHVLAFLRSRYYGPIGATWILNIPVSQSIGRTVQLRSYIANFAAYVRYRMPRQLLTFGRRSPQ